MRYNADLVRKHYSQKSFFKRHSLTIIAGSITLFWIIAYIFSDEHKHVGSFFGNAIADWTGVVVAILCTKKLYEKGSKESRQPHDKGLAPARKFLIDHSLSIFLVLSGLGWVIAFAVSDPEGKWGQVIGNIVSEWGQQLGIVLLTKKFVEPGSKV